MRIISCLFGHRSHFNGLAKLAGDILVPQLIIAVKLGAN